MEMTQLIGLIQKIRDKQSPKFYLLKDAFNY